MSGAFSALKVKLGFALAARSTKSRTASNSRSSSGFRRPRSGTDNLGTRHGVSPATPRGSRLVAITVTVAHAVSSAPTALGRGGDDVLAVVDHQHASRGPARWSTI